MKAFSTRTLVAAGLLVSLVLAGVVSFYASSSPDGLNRVALDNGFSSSQMSSRTSPGPLAGYETKGVENDRFSGGLAGVLGCLAVLSLSGGLVLVVRRDKARVSVERGD
jgi:cobalt/nickel transport protein